jgi:hypothetical protein
MKILISAVITFALCYTPRMFASNGPLDALTRPRGTSIAHYSSWDRNGKNEDFRAIGPGETLTLMDHRGGGVVRRFWLTISPRNHIALQRQLIIRAYWDDETTPSVEVPVSDFFGMGFGEWRDYISLPLNMTSGGYNCYWAMPFRSRGRITVENRSAVSAERFYFNVDVETGAQPEDVLYFHAQFRRTATERGKPVVLLSARGRGHYVGTQMSMQPRSGRSLGYLEGNERVFIDGETSPRIIGTGTEDYFSSGWYYDTGAYSAPYHGAPIVEPQSGRISTYRWHIEDPIPFERSLEFTIEHGGTNETQGVDYATVAYWYQTHPHAPFPALPSSLLPAEPLKARKKPGLIEAESLLPTARATAGDVRVQDMAEFESEKAWWSGGNQLWWVESKPGAKLALTFDAPAERTYELIGYFTRASNYGKVRLSVNGKQVGPEVDGYSRFVEPTGPISFGRVSLRRGSNDITVEITGKDPRSQGWSEGYLVGIDGFELRE